MTLNIKITNMTNINMTNIKMTNINMTNINMKSFKSFKIFNDLSTKKSILTV